MLIGDSQCTIACVKADNRVLDVWFSNRVAEVQDRMESWKRKNIKVNDLYHWPGVTNVVDLVTKGCAVYSDVKEGSVWQEGPKDTQYPVEEWPISRDFVRAIPEEEKRATIFGVHMSLMPREVTVPPAVVGREDNPPQSLSCRGIQGQVNKPLSCRGIQGLQCSLQARGELVFRKEQEAHPGIPDCVSPEEDKDDENDDRPIGVEPH